MLSPNVPVASFGPVQAYLAGLAPSTRGDSRRQLDTIARILRPGADAVSLSWHELTYRETSFVRAALSERMRYRYANQHLYSLRSVLREAFNLGLMEANTYLMAVSFKPIKGRSPQAGRLVHPEEFAKLFQSIAADHSPLGVRDLAMLGTLHATGMRAVSLRRLTLASYDPVTCMFTALGKGNVEHVVAAARWIEDPIAHWLRLRGTQEGALFCKVHHSGAVNRKREMLAHATLDYVHHKRRKAAGVAPFTLHDYRRTLASELFDADVDPNTVRDQLGHADLATTSSYDRRGNARLARAVRNVRNPLA